MRSQCPRLRSAATRKTELGPEHPDTPAQSREGSSDQVRDNQVNLVKIVAKSSALDGMKVREVTVMTVDDLVDLRQFVQKVEKVDEGDDLNSEGTDEEEEDDDDDDAAPVMAGARARHFSNLLPEFDREAGPASQRPRTENDDNADEASPRVRKVTPAAPKLSHKPIQMMAGHEKFDFVGAFLEAPVTGLNWG